MIRCLIPSLLSWSLSRIPPTQPRVQFLFLSIEKLGLLSCHDLAEFYPFFITHIFVILRLRLTIINPINGFLMKIQ